jgi:hypothetical protein
MHIILGIEIFGFQPEFKKLEIKQFPDTIISA